MRKLRQRGITRIELLVAVMASGIVLYALGNIIVANQRAMKRSQERVALRSYTAAVMSRMARAVRVADRLEVTDKDAFRVRGPDGSPGGTFRRVPTADGPRLQMDGVDMTELDCTRFVVSANADTTRVTVDLELRSDDGVTLGALNTVAIGDRERVPDRDEDTGR